MKRGRGVKGGRDGWVDWWAYYLLQTFQYIYIHIYIQCKYFTSKISEQGEGSVNKNWFLILCDLSDGCDLKRWGKKEKRAAVYCGCQNSPCGRD
jgi:hypothetical protein